MTEQELVERAKAGDEEAFAQLLESQQNRVYTLMLRMTRNPEDALDLSQEAFLKAWRSLQQFQGNSSFSTWMYRLANNVCIDFLRKKKRQKEHGASVSFDDEQAFIQEPVAPDADPHHQIEQKEVRKAVEQELQSLPEHYRQVLVMRELSGFSYQEISDILGIDLGTVKSRIARARLTMQKNLTGNLFEGFSSKKKNSKGR